MRAKHADKEAVAQCLKKGIDKLQSSSIMAVISNMGDNKHNRTVIKAREGEIILPRVPRQGVTLADFNVCNFCFLWVQDIAKHLSTEGRCKGPKNQSLMREEEKKLIQNQMKRRIMVEDVYTLESDPDLGKIISQEEHLPTLHEDLLEGQYVETLREQIDEISRIDAASYRRITTVSADRTRRKRNTKTTDYTAEYESGVDESEEHVIGADVAENISAETTENVQYSYTYDIAESKLSLSVDDAPDTVLTTITEDTTTSARGISAAEDHKTISSTDRGTAAAHKRHRRLPLSKDLHSLGVFLVKTISDLLLRGRRQLKNAKQFGLAVQIVQIMLLLFNKHLPVEIGAIR